MVRALVPVMVAMVVLWSAPARAQDGDAAHEPLQGRWVVTGGEHDGQPLDSITGGVMTIAGNAFEVRTAGGNMLKGTLHVDASARPARLDLLHADGEVWEAIFEVDASTFRMNYVPKGGPDPRPTGFSTAEKTEQTVVMLRRESGGR